MLMSSALISISAEGLGAGFFTVTVIIFAAEAVNSLYFAVTLTGIL